jgi:hypothetical protein
MSCGTSSKLVRRSKRPTRVMRGSLCSSGERAYLGASTFMLRNFRISKGRPSRPVRVWRKKMGPFDSKKAHGIDAQHRGVQLSYMLLTIGPITLDV